GGVSAIERDGLVAGAHDHALQGPALHRVVIDDQDRFWHGCVLNGAVPFWGAPWRRGLNALLRLGDAGAVRRRREGRRPAAFSIPDSVRPAGDYLQTTVTSFSASLRSL